MNRIEKIQKVFEDVFLLYPGQITQGSRTEPIITARHALAYYLNKQEGLPTRAVRHLLGFKDHGSIINATRRFQNFLDTEPKTRKRYKTAIKQLNNND
tara:strand:+ start:1018 stop:1311 length:294 start_codon:yes stop_codon:yes gene_type:complete